MDFGCGWLMYELYKTGSLTAAGAAFVLYNFLAFGLQFAIGAVTDTLRERGRLYHKQCAALGCVLLCAGLTVGRLCPWAAVICVGLGNAAFHVGGGTDSLIYSRGGSGRCGIFVASGAVGVSLGMLTGGTGKLDGLIPAAAAAVCALLILFFGQCREKHRAPAEYLTVREAAEPSGRGAAEPSGRGAVAPSGRGAAEPSGREAVAPSGRGALVGGAAGAMLCLFAVLVRSYAGFLFNMPWKSGFLLILVSAVAAALGKAVGGLLADRLGARLTGALSVLISAPLVVLGGGSVALSLLGLFLFNIAMPITLYTAAGQFRDREGFAFGLTTLALLIGYLGFTFIELNAAVAAITVTVLTLTAAVAIYFSVPSGRGGERQ